MNAASCRSRSQWWWALSPSWALPFGRAEEGAALQADREAAPAAKSRGRSAAPRRISRSRTSPHPS